MNKNEKLMLIFQNEQFKAECSGLKTAEDLQKLLAKYDLKLTLEEVNELCARIACSAKGGELDEADMEYVTGGSWVVAGAIALGVVCIGSFAIGVYNGYKSTRK